MKKFVTVLLTCLTLLGCILPAYALNGEVTYGGKADQFIFAPGSYESPTDLFPEFKDVMPGDTLTQKITVRNEASNKVKVKIYLRSLGANDDASAAFLSQLQLQVAKSADNAMGYMFDAAADQTAQLTDWVCLGTLYSGGEVDLDVTLHVPVTLDNTFQDYAGYLDWEFMIEEFPIESDDPTPPTGDSFNAALWLAVMGGAAAMIAFLFVWRKKERENTAK